jgi:hypothetical protein
MVVSSFQNHCGNSEYLFVYYILQKIKKPILHGVIFAIICQIAKAMMISNEKEY